MKKKLVIAIYLVLLCVINTSAQGKLAFYKFETKKYRYTPYLDSTKYFFKKALPIAKKEKDSVTVFWLYKFMGDAYEHHQKLDSTLQMYAYCKQFTPKNNLKLKSFLLNDLAYTYQLFHDFDKAAQLTLKALEYAELSKDVKQIATVCITLADNFAKQKLYNQSEYYYKKAFELGNKINSNPLKEYTHRYYGNFLLETNKIDSAYYHLTQASNFAIQSKDSISMAFAWIGLAECYWKKKQIDNCFLYAKKAEGIWQRRAEYIDYAHVCMNQGVYYFQLNHFLKAESYFLKAEKHNIKDLYFREKLYSNFAKLYKANQKLKKAIYYLEKAKATVEQIKEIENKSKVASLNIQFDTERKEKTLKVQFQKNKIAALTLSKKNSQIKIVSIILFFLIFSTIIISYFYKKIQRKNKLLFFTNSKLEQALDQKENLLKELHHRVKNNLTTLKSLLYLQAKSTKNVEVKTILHECQLRIQSMAFIHQNLLEEIGNDKVNFSLFFNQLLHSLEESYRQNDKNIEITHNIQEVTIDFSVAICLGLILNEWVTNSFKYAFINQTAGKIHLQIFQQSNILNVIYSDNGSGLPNGFSENQSGFGFKIISILTKQINAQLKYSNQNNVSCFSMTIPYA